MSFGWDWLRRVSTVVRRFDNGFRTEGGLGVLVGLDSAVWIYNDVIQDYNFSW